MILLSHKGDEALFIGEDIVIKLTRVAGGRALIGVHAPKEVKALREEIAGELRQKRGEGGMRAASASGLVFSAVSRGGHETQDTEQPERPLHGGTHEPAKGPGDDQQ